jgi:hypothetical protein
MVTGVIFYERTFGKWFSRFRSVESGTEEREHPSFSPFPSVEILRFGFFEQKETEERKGLRALSSSMISCLLDGEAKDLVGTSSVLSVSFCGNSSIRIFYRSIGRKGRSFALLNPTTFFIRVHRQFNSSSLHFHKKLTTNPISPPYGDAQNHMKFAQNALDGSAAFHHVWNLTVKLRDLNSCPAHLRIQKNS